ncbi:MAG TPA: RNA polymerase sigma factor [Ktedonobacterales bacterium]|jgi:RNA polymerase sigma-70 factor (ECF subfamily)
MFQHAPPASERHPLAMLYQRHASAIFDYARKQLSSVEDAEDLLVEVFLAALEQPYFFGLSEQEQHAWLWRVAHNKVVDIYRRRNRQRQIPLGETHQSIVDEQDASPEQASLDKEQDAHLQALIKQLSPMQQRVLQLRFGEELRSAEIAAQIGKREGTVRSILSRTLNHLRGLYEKPPEKS